MSDKAVFLDRDNTILSDPGYLSDPNEVKLLPGAALALQSLSQAGYKLVVVTNQSGVARGLLTEQTLEQIHAEMRRQLSEQQVHLDGIYYCPYHPEGTVEAYAEDSPLRKPRPGMLLKAAEELAIDLEHSWAIGDSPRDVEAGQRAGCRTVLIRSRADRHEGEPHEESVRPDHVVRNIVDAARLILRRGPDPQDAGAAAAATSAGPTPQPTRPPGRSSADAAEGAGLSVATVAGVAAQVLAPLSLLAAVVNLLAGPAQQAIAWALVAVALQTAALTAFVTRRR
ncbi:MAG: HAD family hydrolase [Phycisphaerae bacterium]|nr:HAD family hydrolase [Phycisphaerae bacterium]